MHLSFYFSKNALPCRYIHSPSTVCAASDIEAQYRLAKAFLEK